MTKSLHECFHLPNPRLPLLFLAPMAGYTHAPMRRLCRQHGAALTYTEMTNDLGLLHASDKTWHLLETFEDEGPVVAHLYGSDPVSLSEAAARVEQTGRFAGIDLNAGCPVRKITANGAGAALIHDPRRIHAILAAMRRAVRLPLTLKTRLGPCPDRVAIFEILDAAEQAGADALALHGRFTSQGHGGPVHLDLLAEVKQRARLPIIGNGGVTSPRDAWHMLQETRVDAVMIARAAIGNPWIFEDTQAALACGNEPPATAFAGARPRRDLTEIRNALETHMAAEVELIERIRERYALPRNAAETDETLATTFRCHLFRYLHGLKGSSYVRGRLHELQTLDAIRAAVASCLEREAAYRASAPDTQR
ncbi:MAG TPA: tRNA-dihydrouridine synthase family protein [Kiritimatiellia bacterium]|nr:tRNA-dihydrouridine synthase family protein [Kiritimatiellia bacterium]